MFKYRPRDKEKRLIKIGFWCTEEEHKELKIKCAERRMTITNLMFKALNLYFKEGN